MKKIKILFGIIVIIALLYSGIWFGCYEFAGYKTYNLDLVEKRLVIDYDYYLKRDWFIDLGKTRGTKSEITYNILYAINYPLCVVIGGVLTRTYLDDSDKYKTIKHKLDLGGKDYDSGRILIMKGKETCTYWKNGKEL